VNIAKISSYKYLLLAFLILTIGFFVDHAQKDERNKTSENIQSSAVASGAEENIPTSVTEPPVEFTLVAGGDVMLSRHVGTKIREAGDPLMPWRKIADIFAAADIAFVNLEAPFYDQDPPVTEGMIFKVEPENIAGLTHAEINMVSLANNHAKNKGNAGLEYTMNYLNQHDIDYSGAGNNYQHAHTPGIIEAKDKKIAFLSYTYSDGANFESTSNQEKPDIAFMDVTQMQKDIEKAQEQADTIIVSMHAGYEYTPTPNQQQKDFAHVAIDSGADLVLGHHPHVVQTTEVYNDKFIIYSLGNLVFDQMWSEETREGVIARLNFRNADLQKAEFIPIKIENYNQPRLATTAESARILGRMGLEESVVEF